MSTPRPPGILNDPSARTLIAGDLEAIFLPSHGMLCASLRHRGAEILRRVQDLETGAARGSTAGIPLLHPWANRLAEPRYRTAGRDVELDPSSPLLHFDEHGLPMHGVPWSRLTWEVTENRQDSLVAQLDWTQGELLALFPYRHQMELTATLRPDGLTFETTLNASMDGPVPVSFGFHPYLGLPGLPRAQWRLTLPPLRKLVLDPHGSRRVRKSLLAGSTPVLVSAISMTVLPCPWRKPRSLSPEPAAGSRWGCSQATAMPRFSRRRIRTTSRSSR